MKPSTITIVLNEPITVGDVTTARLTLSEPTGEHLAAAELVPGSIASLMALISANGVVPMSVVKKLRQRDLQRAADFFASFSEPDLETPGSSASSEPASGSTT